MSGHAKTSSIGGSCLLRLGITVYAASLVIAQDHPEASPAEFLARVARYCLAEIQTGNMAQKQAHSVEVADFATKSVDQYTKMQSELKDLASKENVTLPTDLTLNSLNLQAELQSSPSSKVFDSFYMNGIRAYQREQLTDFRAQAQTSRDSAVKAFAVRYIPIIEASTEEADRIYGLVQNQTTTPRQKQ